MAEKRTFNPSEFMNYLYPQKTIGYDIYWYFSTKRYDTIKEFQEELVKYNRDIKNINITDDINTVCVNYPTFAVGNISQEWECDNFVAVFHADNQKSFTTVEILWKLHNWLIDNHVDLYHRYFEGINAPSGKINLGS